MNCRRLFRVATSAWLLFFLLCASASTQQASVLYSFQAHGDGAIPAGGVIFGKAGNLYGATQDGGTPGVGAVFQLKPPAKKGKPWTETLIHSFQSGDDGDIPTSGVISDRQGNLYGVTEYGGTGNCEIAHQVVGCGVVYELSPTTSGAGWSETILYNFQGGHDGDFPFGNLLLANGSLYGTTEYGGGSADCSPAGPSCGAVFELSPPAVNGAPWNENVLYAFRGGRDGGYPNGQLVTDKRGILYGTTYLGGNQGCSGFGMVGCGIAFALIPPKDSSRPWTEKIIHRFHGGNHGGNPWAGLAFDKHGNLYGTTMNGGRGAAGVVFKLAPPMLGSNWAYTEIHDFVQPNGGLNPEASLTIDANGNLYGTACCGGDPEFGAVFRLQPNADPQTWTYDIVYSFKGSPDGASPAAGLIFDQSGNLYSTTLLGGTGTECDFGGIIGCGTVFRITPR